MLTEFVDPPDRLLYVIARPSQRAATQSNYSSTTIVGVLSLGNPIVGLELGHSPADGRDGNARHPVKGGHGTGPSFQVAADDLIHDTQLVKRAVASVLLCRCLKHFPHEFDNSLRRYLVWLIRHTLVAIPGFSQ